MLLTGCRAMFFAPAQTATPTVLIPATAPPNATRSTNPVMPSPTPAATATLPFPPMATAPVFISRAPVGYQVRLHPDGALFAGDRVSLEVIAQAGVNTQDQSVELFLDVPENPLANLQSLGKANFNSFGLGERSQATFLWAWDTSQLAPGEYRLSISIQPQGPTWTETILLFPRAALPWPESQARWANTKSQCCTIYYLTHTEAERDLPALQIMVDDQARDASQRLGIEFSDPITITFLARVLGHGGFTSQEIAVTNVDRNYAAGLPSMVIHHEMIHALDNRLGGEHRPNILVEGLAVYLSGGHFKPEPLMQRAAALLPQLPGCLPIDSKDLASEPPPPLCGLGLYIPLKTLTDNFYPAQHEIGYLEGAALVEFLVNTWGWQAFSELYRNMPSPALAASLSGNQLATQSEILDMALQQRLGINLAELERRFIEALRQETLTAKWINDIRLTVEFYDTMRRYQQLLDPSAYYLTAWLPEPADLRQRGIVADYLRRPQTPANLALELMLSNAGAALNRGEYQQVQDTLTSIHHVLDQASMKENSPFAADSLANDYYAIVASILNYGYEPQRLTIDYLTAQVWVRRAKPELTLFKYTKIGGAWVLDAETLALKPFFLH